MTEPDRTELRGLLIRPSILTLLRIVSPCKPVDMEGCSGVQALLKCQHMAGTVKLLTAPRYYKSATIVF